MDTLDVACMLKSKQNPNVQWPGLKCNMFALLFGVLHGSWRCALCPEAWWRTAGPRSDWWWRCRSEAGRPQGLSHCNAAADSYPGLSGSGTQTDGEWKGMKFNIRQSWNKNECVRNKLYSNGIKSTSYVEVPAQNKKMKTLTTKINLSLILLHLLLSVCILPPVSMTVYFKVKNISIYKWS